VHAHDVCVCNNFLHETKYLISLNDLGLLHTTRSRLESCGTFDDVLRLVMDDRGW
jgi:hypothetical protein